jgi:hypothetical protein
LTPAKVNRKYIILVDKKPIKRAKIQAADENTVLWKKNFEKYCRALQQSTAPSDDHHLLPGKSIQR